jgi:DNA-binding transcriptional MerR regulator
MTRYVHSLLLIPVQIRDNGRRYFRRKDLEKLIASQKQFLNSAEVRKILEIGPTQLFRLAATGILKPISGPLIDGSTFNVFKRSDVERLHEERQGFKRERLETGGSDRFGSPAGPRSHPVLSVIEPRVKQLLAEATVNGTRLSGLSIHRELLKEGYEAHFNTVYSCLHHLARTTAQL